MTIRYKTWAWALVALLAAAPAFADDEDAEGPYVFVTAGEAAAYNGCQSGWITALAAAGSSASCSWRSEIYRVGVGYQLTPTWGLEVNYGTFGNANSSGYAYLPPYPTASSYTWQLKAAGLAFQAVATVHLTDTLAVFGKAGLARVEFTESMESSNPSVPPPYIGVQWSPTVRTNVNTPALGAGIRYDVGPHGSIFAVGEYFGSRQIYTLYSNDAKVRLVSASLGLMYRY